MTFEDSFDDAADRNKLISDLADVDLRGSVWDVIERVEKLVERAVEIVGRHRSSGGTK
jgi:hypothetical protein